MCGAARLFSSLSSSQPSKIAATVEGLAGVNLSDVAATTAAAAAAATTTTNNNTNTLAAAAAVVTISPSLDPAAKVLAPSPSSIPEVHVPVLPPLTDVANLLPPWNRRIPSDKNLLTIMHEVDSWIPGEHQIRPSPQTLLLKATQMDTVERFYVTMTDYVLDLVFNFPTRMTGDGKLQSYAPTAGSGKREKKKIFRPNEFPYSLSPGSHHSIMWYSYGPPNDLTEEDINADIYAALASEVLNHESFEFVWYENPKMTVPGIYHVQVFWHEVEAPCGAGQMTSQQTSSSLLC